MLPDVIEDGAAELPCPALEAIEDTGAEIDGDGATELPGRGAPPLSSSQSMPDNPEYIKHIEAQLTLHHRSHNLSPRVRSHQYNGC